MEICSITLMGIGICKIFIWTVIILFALGLINVISGN
jgi:hypothetical protein